MSSLVVLQGVALDDPTLVQDVSRLVAFVLASGLVSAVAALVFRWYTREPVPLGVSNQPSLRFCQLCP